MAFTSVMISMLVRTFLGHRAGQCEIHIGVVQSATPPCGLISLNNSTHGLSSFSPLRSPPTYTARNGLPNSCRFVYERNIYSRV